MTPHKPTAKLDLLGESVDDEPPSLPADTRTTATDFPQIPPVAELPPEGERVGVEVADNH